MLALSAARPLAPARCSAVAPPAPLCAAARRPLSAAGRRALPRLRAATPGSAAHGEQPEPGSGNGATGSSGGEARDAARGRRRLAVSTMDEDLAEDLYASGVVADLGGALHGGERLLDRDPYKEDSRRFFRTVFDHDRWAAHRSTRRYLRHVLFLHRSRIVRGLAAPLLYSGCLATAVATYHTLAETGVLPEVAYALQIRTGEPFSLTSFALSLLLVFRTNASYSRWLDARKSWGQLVNRSRDLVRQGITYMPRDQPALTALLCRWTVAYSRSLMCHLRNDVDAGAELRRVLRPEEAEAALAAEHRPNYCLQVLSEAVMVARGAASGGAPGAPRRAAAAAPPGAGGRCPEGAAFRMDENLTLFADAAGQCERILRTPIPLSYTRHTSRFMMIWLTLLPFSLWDSCRWAMVPLSIVIAFLLLGIEEIGVAIEEPFSILPLEQICDAIEGNVRELQRMHAAGSAGDGAPAPRALSASQVVSAALLPAEGQPLGWR